MMYSGSRGLIWMARNLAMALILFLIFMWIFMPILWAFSMSLKDVKEIFGMPTRFIPYTPSLDNYYWLFQCLPEWPTYFKNSIITTVGAVATTIFCSFLMGYAFARISFRGRDLIFYSLIAAMFIPQIGLLMAQYEIMHVFNLRNSLWGLAFLFASNLGVPAFIMRQSFMSMPGDIEDAARIDGASRLRFLLEIGLPFASSGVIIVAILTFVNVWGEYLITLTMIDDQKLYTLGIGMAMFSTCGAAFKQAGTNFSLQGIRAASYLVTSAPVVLLFIMMQDSFAQGLTEGAVKQ
jgi:ABC-type glycerol-3-phosphate transport system permease component